MNEPNTPATTSDDPGKELTQQQAKANPFKAIAMILESVCTSLENPKEEGKAPRWIRMVRIREFQGESDYISKAVIPVLEGLNTVMWYLMNLTLQAKDMLSQADAAKAMWEVSEKMLTIMASDEFSTAIAQVINPETQSEPNPLGDAKPYIQQVSGFIDRIPSPEDLDLLGSQFFRLLSIELLPLDETGLSETTEVHINLNNTGKLRLIQMGLGKPMTICGLGIDKKGTQKITYLGGRRLLQGGNFATKALAKWGDPKKPDTVYEFNFTGTGTANKEAGEGADLEEVNNLLEKMGYVTPEVKDKKVFSAELQQRLESFQKLNGLAVNGKLDNSTINRLMHFNFETKSIERAVAYKQVA